MDILSTAEAAQLMGVSGGTLRYWRYLDQGPRSFRIGRHVRYLRADIEAWLDDQMAATARGRDGAGGRDETLGSGQLRTAADGGDMVSIFDPAPQPGENGFDHLARCANLLEELAFKARDHGGDVTLTQEDCVALIDIMHTAHWAWTEGR